VAILAEVMANVQVEIVDSGHLIGAEVPDVVNPVIVEFLLADGASRSAQRWRRHPALFCLATHQFRDPNGNVFRNPFRWSYCRSGAIQDSRKASKNESRTS
jgi:hypothetical protein